MFYQILTPLSSLHPGAPIDLTTSLPPGGALFGPKIGNAAKAVIETIVTDVVGPITDAVVEAVTVAINNGLVGAVVQAVVGAVIGAVVVVLVIVLTVIGAIKLLRWKHRQGRGMYAHSFYWNCCVMCYFRHMAMLVLTFIY